MIVPLRKTLKSVVTVIVAAITSTAAAMTVELTPKPDPAESGDNRLMIKVVDDAGTPVDGANVTAIVFMPAMGTMPRMEQKTNTQPKGGGVYESAYDLPMRGTWEITVTVAIAEVKNVSHFSITTGIPGVTAKDSGRPSGGPGTADASNVMDLGPDRLQKIGVRFAEAKVMPMHREIEAIGVIEQDQTHREEVTLRFSGYVVKQLRGRIGDYVTAGEPLFSVYSPDLVTAQGELLLADKLAMDGHSLHQAAGEKLKNLGLSARDIAQIRRDGKPMRDVLIRATVAGTILDITAREGAAVNAGQVVYVIGDLSKSFIVARIFQQDVGDLKVGQTASITIPGSGDKQIQGHIDLIYPQVEQGAGTANVRVVVSEYIAGLRPGAYVDVAFAVDLGALLSISAESVLYSGRHRYVFVDRGGGVLEPREVTVGKAAAGMVEIRAGLAAGERIAASGTFLLGSEAQLRSALPKWKDSGATK